MIKRIPHVSMAISGGAFGDGVGSRHISNNWLPLVNLFVGFIKALWRRLG